MSRIYGGNNSYNNLIIEKTNDWNGYIKYAPYDIIHVGASAETIPKQLLEQLKINGKMIIPVKNDYLLVTKTTSVPKIQ